jgi:hypothetical protein
MIFWISDTAIGSIPANGSSSRMNFGEMTSARVNLRPPALAARQRVCRRLRERRQVELGEQLAKPGAAAGAIEIRGLQDASRFCSTVSPRNIDGSCGR